MAKDEAGLGDGTQASGFGDPLTGSPSDPHDDFQLTRVASPVKPDAGAIKRLVEAEMARDHRLDLDDTGQIPPVDDATPPPAAPAEAISPAPPLGMLPRQRTRPGLRNYRRALRMPRIGLPQPGTVRKVKPSSGSTGVIVAVVLMIAFVVLAIEFLSSLVSSIINAFS